MSGIRRVPPADAPRARPAGARRASLIRQAISLALHYPQAAAAVGPVAGLEGVRQPGLELLLAILASIRERPHITTAGLLERFRDIPEGRHLGKLAAQAPLDDAQAAREVLEDSLLRIVAEYRKHRLAELVARRQSLDEGERRELSDLLKGTGRGAG